MGGGRNGEGGGQARAAASLRFLPPRCRPPKQKPPSYPQKKKQKPPSVTGVGASLITRLPLPPPNSAAHADPAPIHRQRKPARSAHDAWDRAAPWPARQRGGCRAICWNRQSLMRRTRWPVLAGSGRPAWSPALGRGALRDVWGPRGGGAQLSVGGRSEFGVRGASARCVGMGEGLPAVACDLDRVWKCLRRGFGWEWDGLVRAPRRHRKRVGPRVDYVRGRCCR